MTNFMSNNRWYDKDATVSLAVSILRNAPAHDQLSVAELIIEKGQRHNITLSKNNNNGIMDLFTRRWYDYDDKLSEAMEYLKLSPFEIQKEMAIEIINYLCNLDCTCIQDQ